MVWRPNVISLDRCPSDVLGDLYYAWTYGDLRYKLDPLQVEADKAVRAYFAGATTSFARGYVFEWARRLGKDFFWLRYCLEQMARNRGHRYGYGTATHKELLEILLPLLDQLMTDCPKELQLNKTALGHYEHPLTGSVLVLAGLDLHPDGLRGSRLDGLVITEYAYIRNIERVEAAIIPQLLDNKNAWWAYLSTPSESTGHKWCADVVPKARLNENYSLQVLDSCPRYDREQIEAAYNEFGGRETDKSRREYRCEHITDSDLAIIPEWDKARHTSVVESWPVPSYYHAYLVIDPGQTATDRHGHLYAYYDFKQNKLVFTRAYTMLAPKTSEVAAAIRQDEALLWAQSEYWDGRRTIANPYKRVSDTQLQLINDLTNDYDLPMIATQKHDLMSAVQHFRDWIHRGACVFLPGTEELQLQLSTGIWHDKSRKQFAHISKALGHFDLVACCVYLTRNIETQLNPFPPAMQPGKAYKDHHNPYYDYTPEPTVESIWTT